MMLAPPSADDEMFMLLDVAARQLTQSADPAAFLDWVAEAGPVLAPSLAAQVDSAAGPPSQFFRLMGVHIYSLTPLAEHGFVRQALPKPARNDLCLCGSGRKYKQCCIDMENLPMLEHYNMLRHVLDHCSLKALAQLPATRVDTEAVADTAEQWLDEGDVRRALALLEPWFKPGQKLKRQHIFLFDSLMDIYLYEEKPIKRKRLLERVCNAEDKQLRAMAYQRKATILADTGDVEGAWEAFIAAQRLDPSSPALSVLEITLLCSRGDSEQAKARAAFWLARLQRDANSPDELLDFLTVCTEDPEAALFDQGTEGGLPEAIDELMAMLYTAPLPVALYTVESHGSEAMLEPSRQLARLDGEWNATVQAVTPSLTHTQHDDPVLWDTMSEWLLLLQDEPELWHSFQVLDDLVMGIDALRIEELVPVLLEPLLDRAQALLECNLKQSSIKVNYTLPWLMMENRAALRLLAHGAFHLLHEREETGPDFIQRAERLIQLNPNDNHGIRDALSTVYIANNQPDKAIALLKQFPDDMLCATALNHVLALYIDKQKGKALSRLKSIADRFQVAIDMLLSDKPTPPEFSEYGVRMGGEDEAWLYRESTLMLWQNAGALDWLHQAVNSLSLKRR